ncbi:OTU domain-containing protein 3 [Dorcoceras hygrometricum]|uniref:OTU domain-containing protein 3 n=1 Tax=Dorcoceras hygrometricum TaxID=472368 RepID=A0A2Z7CUM1_9LAMI|nr:OTU domain-containing protein 3 [Dorcoceras hygrometricum]
MHRGLTQSRRLMTPAPKLRRPPPFSRPTTTHRRAPPSAASCRDRTCYDQLFEEFPFMSNLSVLLVQADEGLVLPVVDLIRRSTAAYLLKCRFPYETGRSQAPRRQQGRKLVQRCKLVRIKRKLDQLGAKLVKDRPTQGRCELEQLSNSDRTRTEKRSTVAKHIKQISCHTCTILKSSEPKGSASKT